MKTLRALALALLVSAAAAFAANTVALMPTPRMQFLDANGYPLAGGLLYTCVAGSTCPGSPLASYTDSTGNTANANPVVLDAGGFASVWLGTSAYKIVLQNASGVTQWTQDNVQAANAIASSGSSALQTALAAASGAGLVGFQASGGVVRTVAAKLGDLLSVKDYGAKMDGATDDSAALQACLNTGACYVPAGTLKYGTTANFPINSPGSAHLTCAAHGSVLSYTGSGDALAVLAGSSGANNIGFEIDNCSISGSTSGASGLHLRAFQGGLVRNLTVYGFTNGDGVLNEGANSITFENLIVGGNKNGVHEKGVNLSGVGYSANANHFLGGVSENNSKWGAYEDASAVSGPVTANQNNVYEMIFETNGTAGVPSGQVYFQGCDACEVRNSYLEAANGSTVPYNTVIGGTATDGIGNLAYRTSKVIVRDNYLGSTGTPSIKVVSALGYSISDNWEAGNPTYFLDIGSNGLSSGSSLRNMCLSCSVGYLNGTDASGLNVTDGATSLVNASSPTIYGTGYNSITSASSSATLAIRQNATSANIVNFQNTGGTTQASITPAGTLAFNGFAGVPQDSPGFKYKTVASCTTAAALYATCNTTVTWATAFTDTGYLAICNPAGNVNGVVSVVDQPSRSASALTVTIANTGNNSSASYTTLACAAWHP